MAHLDILFCAVNDILIAKRQVVITFVANDHIKSVRIQTPNIFNQFLTGLYLASRGVMHKAKS